MSREPAGEVVYRAKRGSTPADVSGHEKGSSRQDGYSTSLTGDQIQLAYLLYSAVIFIWARPSLELLPTVRQT